MKVMSTSQLAAYIRINSDAHFIEIAARKLETENRKDKPDVTRLKKISEEIDRRNVDITNAINNLYKVF